MKEVLLTINDVYWFIGAGLMTTTYVGWFGIQPINREIKAGVSDPQRLTVLLG